jgi:hypothetical protein
MSGIKTLELIPNVNFACATYSSDCLCESTDWQMYRIALNEKTGTPEIRHNAYIWSILTLHNCDQSSSSVGFCVSANWISRHSNNLSCQIEGLMASISRVPGAKGQEDTLNILLFLKTATDIDTRIQAVLLQTLTAVLQRRQTLSLIVSNLHQRIWTKIKRSRCTSHRDTWRSYTSING